MFVAADAGYDKLYYSILITIKQSLEDAKDCFIVSSRMFLQCCFYGCPGCIWVVFWYDNRDLVANIDTEVRYAGEQYAILSAQSLYIVGAIVLH